jgi:hypothetical protein
MTRRDEARCDEVGEVVDGGVDPVLHGRSRQVVSAQQQVDGLSGVEAECLESDVHDSGV